MKNEKPEFYGIDMIKEQCPHTDRIQSMYRDFEEVYRPGWRYGFILCLVCAIERWPDDNIRYMLWCTEIGDIGDYVYRIVG